MQTRQEAEDGLQRGLRASVALALASTAISLVAVELAYRAFLEARHRPRVARFRSETWQLTPGSPPVFRLPDFMQWFDARHPNLVIHRAVATWGGELGLEVVDVLPTFHGKDHRLFWIPADGHPNATAHEIVAGVLRDRLVARLGPGVGAAAGAPVVAEPAGKRR